MSGPFLCYREIIPPTSVDAARFFSLEGHGDFLITLTAAAINIYRIHASESDSNGSGVGSGSFFSLFLHTKVFGKPYDVNVFSTPGTSEKREGRERREEKQRRKSASIYIILNFDSGKVSISRFDPLKCSLDLVSLFNAEEEAVGAGSEVHALTQGRQISPAVGATPYLVVDKADAIACTLLYGQQLFFVNLSSLSDRENIPRNSRSTSVTQPTSAIVPKKDAVSKQFIVDIQLSLRLLGPILDYCFLPGYSRPTLAVLQECGPLPTGHAAHMRHTCCLSVLAVDKVTKSVSLLWRQLKLPHDCISIVPLSHPSLCGSIAVVSMNALLLVSQEAVIGTATCGFASTTVSPHIKLQPSKLSEGLELDASRWIEADNRTLVGSLKDGRLLSVQLSISTEALIQEMRFETSLLASSVRCSCFCKSETLDLWFLGSRLSDCLLVEAAMQYPDQPMGLAIGSAIGAGSLGYPGSGSGGKSPHSGSGSVTPSAKRARRMSNGSMSVETPGVRVEAADIDAEECDLYGTVLANRHAELGSGSRGRTLSTLHAVGGSSSGGSSSRSSLKYLLRVTDKISVLGPVIDGTFCGNEETIDQVDRIEWNRVGMPLKKVAPNPASAYIVDREAKDCLHLYTGLDEQSSVHRITRGVRVSKLASRSFPNATGVQSLQASEAYSLLFVNFPDKSRVFQCTASTAKILESGDLGSVILPSDLSVKEISCSDAGFISTDNTITVGLVYESVSVQVVSTCVRVVNISRESGASGEALQDVIVADEIEMGGLGGVPGEVVVCADVCQSWVALLTSTGSVYMLEFDAVDESLVLKYSANCSGSEGSGGEEKGMDVERRSEGMPSFNNLLTLNPVSVSLFRGLFPSRSKDAAANAPSSSSTAAASSSVSSSSSSSSAYMTPAHPAKAADTSLTLLLPDDAVALIKEESTRDHLLQSQLAEEEYLYGDSIDRAGTDNVSDLEVMYEFGVRGGGNNGQEMDVDNIEGVSSSNSVSNGSSSSHQGKSAAKGRVAFVDQNDSERRAGRERGLSSGSYETPGKEAQETQGGRMESEEAVTGMEGGDEVYLVLCDYNGTVRVMSLRTLRSVFEAEAVCLLPQTIPLDFITPTGLSSCSDNEGGMTSRSGDGQMTPSTPFTPITPRTPAPAALGIPSNPSNPGSDTPHTPHTPHTAHIHNHRKVTDRVLVDARFARIGRANSPLELSKLCFIIVLESSDVVVYYLAESKNIRSSLSSSEEEDFEEGSYFVKLEHSVVTRKRKNRIRRKGTNSTSASSSSSLSSLSASLPYCRDEETGPQRIRVTHDTSGSSTVLVSGSRPIIICNDSGVPFLAPLGMPELPFSNSGMYLLTPLRVGGVSGIASLWVESDDIEVQGPGGSISSGAVTNEKKQSTLQLYLEVPNQICYPGSVTSTKRLHSGVTTHRCLELLAKSEDSTEQALLKRKTFILSCSTEKRTPFLSTVLTTEEKEKEESFYDRFFPSLESFSQPDPHVGAAPFLSSREYKLVIMQSGTAVDEYILPLGEQILGVEALYLTVTTATVLPAILQLGQAIVMEKKIKRVFLACCTCVEDKHGEDTQGEGRIMLFGLDYALFQDAVAESAEGKENEDTVDEHGVHSVHSVHSVHTNGTTGAGVGVSGVGGVGGVSGVPVITLQTPQSRSQQSSEQSKFFKAIQPKLKLLWTGPGPASIVKQVGEFILSTVGTTIYVYKLNSETMELDQITFYFAQFFISSVSVMKNYILIADVCNSVQFLVWREEDLTLTLVSKDMDSQTVLSTAFISDGASLGIVVGDDEGNVQLMKFDPRKIETKDGSRLFCMADFHLGSDATLLLSHSLLTAPALLQPPLPPMPPPMQPPLPPMPPPIPPPGGLALIGAPPLPPHPAPLRIARPRQSATSATGQPFGQRLDKLSGGKSCVLIGSIDGGLGMLIPVDERMYRRLALLQQIMSMGVPTPCALNPREYRLIKTTRFVTQKKKGVLDGSLLWKYVGLESTLQDELAAAMGVTADTILENLLELDLLGTFF